MPAGKPPPTARPARRTVLTALGALLTTGCSRALFLAANVPATFGDYRRIADVPYGELKQQTLDLYVPQRSAPRAVVIFWHGGRWEFGDKADYRFVGAALAEIGCLGVVANYRHYPSVRMAGFMEDAARAALYAADHAHDYGADPGRLVLMGHSAGAHIAALLALDTRHFARVGRVPPVAGLIGLSGPYDFLPLQEDDVKDMFGPPARYAESQPIEFVRDGAPPALLVHGLGDDTVWPKNTRNLAAALLTHQVPVELRLYPHIKHADTVAALSRPGRGRAPILADVQTFLDTKLAN